MVSTREPAIWGIHSGRTGEADSLFLKHNMIALGWNKMGDLVTLPSDREAFKVRVAKVYTDHKPALICSGATGPLSSIPGCKTAS